MAKRNRRRRRRRSYGVLYKVISLLVICAVIVAALTLFFKVRTITVTGDSQYGEEEVISASGVKAGDNLFLLNKYSIAEAIRKELPAVDSIGISRRLPDTLVINVTDCIEAGVVEQVGAGWLISSTGRIIGNVKRADGDGYITIDGGALDAPEVGGAEVWKENNESNGENLGALVKALSSSGMISDVTEIDVSDMSNISIKYLGRFTVKMKRGADFSMRLENLKYIIEQLEDNQKGAIDLTIDGEAHYIP